MWWLAVGGADTTGCDGDSDRDGILDCAEQALCAGLPDPDRCPVDPDYDADAVIDGVEVGSDLYLPQDTDADGVPDVFDADDDGDSRPSDEENGIGGCVTSLVDRYVCADLPY